MKRILVVSDSHGNKKDLNELVSQVEHDYMFFLGDTLKDVANINGPNIYKVKGNWDYSFAQDFEQVIDVEGVRFLIVHGHIYSVKQQLNNLLNHAKEVGAQVVCYGHTHVPDFKQIDGVTLINPGAFSFFKSNKKTYALIEVNGENFNVNILNFLK